jgi:hypothetical protein
MKKLLVFSLAALLVAAFCVPASALENVFGGYWRTRMIKQKDFDGSGDGTQDLQRVDTRTRLYYTAILNDNLKFVNKFELDAVWGGNSARDDYGDFGADGKVVEVKNSYVEFHINPITTKMGVFGHELARGFIWSDDSAGVELRFKNDMMTIPFRWFKGYEGGSGNGTTNKFDVDVFSLNPVFKVAESWQIKPFAVYLYSNNPEEALATGGASLAIPPVTIDSNNLKTYWLGGNVDGTIGPVGLWFTGIYQGGKFKGNGDNDNVDIKAYLVAGGGNVDLGPANIHTQGFYASGDGAERPNGDMNGFIGISGQSYYWSEIMGYGIFDQQASAGSPNEKISNVWAANIGASIKPFDKLTITGDLWYAEKPKDDPITDEKKLGTEADLVLTYQLVEGMNVDLIGAYLWAGDATSTDGDNDKNPYEIGSRFSISF